ncbi:ester cyclase [Microlunatus ginsengisoli]|uniref:SnoaL-like polyketide cyclase n=1 Tax=Microlunatus ginsengisoli TaxID=363863 RepID=A0ABP7AGG8_9ACTN
MSTTVDAGTAERLVREQFAIIETGRLELAEHNVTPDFVNHRSITEPPAARGRGPGALQATVRWLRTAFTDLEFELHRFELVGDTAIAWVTLYGRQTGAFVGHDPDDGSVTDVFPATGRSFATRQVHWFRIAGDGIAEHDAVRDDLGLARQLGWVPPRPAYVIRMLLARRRARAGR